MCVQVRRCSPFSHCGAVDATVSSVIVLFLTARRRQTAEVSSVSQTSLLHINTQALLTSIRAAQ